MADYKLKRPCAKCPFRTDVDPYIRPERAEEIARSIARGREFPCHATVDYDDDGERQSTAGESWCAGAIIAQLRTDEPNQQLRIAMRLGVFDPEQMDMTAPVGNLHDFVDKHCENEMEPCSVADYGCLAPAGYMEGGVAVTAAVTEPTSCCEDCGTYVCENCAGSCCDYGNE